MWKKFSSLDVFVKQKSVLVFFCCYLSIHSDLFGSNEVILHFFGEFLYMYFNQVLSLSLQWRNYLPLKCLYFITCGEVKALPSIGAVTSSLALKYLLKYNTVPVFCTDNPFFFCWIKRGSPVWTHRPHTTWRHMYFAWMIPFYNRVVCSLLLYVSAIYI